jgi:hypothetical protein
LNQTHTYLSKDNLMLTEPAKRGKTLYFPSLTIVRQVVVYQPAVPLRAVTVAVEGEKVSTHEETVIGIQAVVSDHYEGAGIPRQVINSDPIPKTLAPADLAAAGYRPEVHSCGWVEHSVVIWNADFGVPMPLADWEQIGQNYEIVVAPATLSESWWASAIQDAERRIRERLAAKAVKGGAA